MCWKANPGSGEGYLCQVYPAVPFNRLIQFKSTKIWKTKEAWYFFSYL